MDKERKRYALAEHEFQPFPTEVTKAADEELTGVKNSPEVRSFHKVT